MKGCVKLKVELLNKEEIKDLFENIGKIKGLSYKTENNNIFYT